MKKTFILSVFCLGFGLNHALSAPDDFRFIPIGKSHPSSSAYVFGTGEQLSGQQFQTDGITTYKGYQYTVYYNSTRNVCIARRKLPAGTWQEVVLPYRNSVDDAHNVISMGICHKDGSIHLAYDHHNDPLHYCRSLPAAGSANEPDEMKWETAAFSATTDVMDKAVPNVTYPRFISKPDGNLLFECRYHWSGHGDSYLREYDGDTKRWTLIGCYVQGEDVHKDNPVTVNGVTYAEDACAYINGMTYDSSGNLHVTWCWRDDYGGETNHDFYYAYSDDHGRTWKNDRKEEVAKTIRQEPGEVVTTSIGCLSQHKWEDILVEQINKNRGYINQETQAVDSKGRIFAVNSHIPDDGGTDGNWNSSRTKARLHLRFLKEDGTWVKRLITDDKGKSIRSNRRVHLAFDRFDNAYIAANGAGLFKGSPADDYAEWVKLSDDIADGYYGEPLTDRPLLKENGVLSYVSLSADNKITVFDYLLDNPNTPDGTGLTAAYFSDDNFSGPISSSSHVMVGGEGFPAGTKSVRWSGTFETSYAEEYTLYLQTTAASTVYVDGVKVLLTRKNAEAKEYAFSFAPIASHKHNIVIEAQADNNDTFSLAWSSATVSKTGIPATALYPQLANDLSAGTDRQEPTLDRKAELADRLLDAQDITGRQTIDITPFNPQGDYSLELKAAIVSSPDCGLVFEGRASNGKGFRLSIDETNLKGLAPYAEEKLLTVADNSTEQSYRLAADGQRVHIYLGEEYVASCPLETIGDLKGAGEEIFPAPEITPLAVEWAGPAGKGTDKPTEYGWDNSVAGIGWNTANGTSGVRYLDVNGSSSPRHTYDGNTYEGRIMTIRWDGTYGTYSYPVQLEAYTAYEFSMLYEWWNNGSPSSISVGISPTQKADDMSDVKSFSTSSKNVLQKAVFNFTSEEAGTYYLIFNGQSGVMYGIAGLELKKHGYEPRLSLSKYCDGPADIKIANLSYEKGAYAPGNEQPDVALQEKETLAENICKDLKLTGVNGEKAIQKMPFDLSGDYSVEIAAAVSAVQGRGMDFEVRDEEGNGFRTALNDTELTWIAPFAQAKVISPSGETRQTIRYAVKDRKVHVFRNGLFVKSFARQAIGDMDENGTSEQAPYSDTPVGSEANQIGNPDFRQTADNGAPAGWTSNGTLGASPNARVQQKGSTDQLNGYPDGTKAFVIRFDGSYQWFSCKTDLQADTWYELSFDLIAWGGNNAGKTLNLTVSTGEAGKGEVMLSQSLTTPASAATATRQSARFKTRQAGAYHISFTKSGSLAGTAGLTNLCLVPYAINGILVGKNYTQGTATIAIDHISVDADGAFAPKVPAPPTGTPSDVVEEVVRLYVNDSQLTITGQEDMDSIRIYDLSGKNVLTTEQCGRFFTTQLPSGVYLVTIDTENNNPINKKAIVR